MKFPIEPFKLLALLTKFDEAMKLASQIEILEINRKIVLEKGIAVYVVKVKPESMEAYKKLDDLIAGMMT